MITMLHRSLKVVVQMFLVLLMIMSVLSMICASCLALKTMSCAKP
jgi:hypothetical protein